MDNRAEQCAIVSKPTYINCDQKIILGRLLGDLDYGDGRKVKDELPMHFSKRNCNYPQAKYAKWFMSQYRRWGMVTGAPDYDGIAKRVMRGDIYEQAMKEIGFVSAGTDNSAETLFDGAVFNPADPEGYAKSFAVKSLKVRPLSTADHRLSPASSSATSPPPLSGRVFQLLLCLRIPLSPAHTTMKKFKLDWLILPLVGVAIILGAWAISSATWAKDLPSPLKTWESSKPYIVEPFA
eukprot:gene60418-82667_t